MAIKMKKVFGFLSALAHAGMVAAPMLVDAGVGAGRAKRVSCSWCMICNRLRIWMYTTAAICSKNFHIASTRRNMKLRYWMEVN